MQEVADTFAAVDAALRTLGVEPGAALVDDSTSVSQYKARTKGLPQALSVLSSLAELAAVAVRIAVDIDGSDVIIVNGDASSAWTVTGNLDGIAWPNEIDPATASTDQLIQHWIETGLPVVGIFSVVVDKSAWVAALHVSRVGVWIGQTPAGFVGWLGSRSTEDTLGLLLHTGPAIVVLSDWTDPPCRLGPNLAVMGLDHASDITDDEGRTAEWPEEVDAWARRAVLIDLAGCPAVLLASLRRAVGWSSAMLIAQEAEGTDLRPDRDNLTRWSYPPETATSAVAPSVTRLARWVAAEPTVTRLAVARKVAAMRLTDALADDTSVIEAADIAYRQTIDATVHQALARQAELEQTFRSIDGDLSTARSGLMNSLDQTLLRAIAGLVAIAAASAATEESSPGFIRFGSLLVAAYVLFCATVELAIARRDIDDRISGFTQLLQTRGQDLARSSITTLASWREQLERRTQHIRLVLVGAAAVIALGGLLVADAVDHSGSTTPTTTTSTTAP